MERNVSIPATFRPVMIFIDGGYIREIFKDKFGHDNIDFYKLVNIMNELPFRGKSIQGELLRAYYYDAIVEQSEDPHLFNKQRAYFDSIEQSPDVEVRLGRLLKTHTGFYRQKGVDVLLAIDMLSMAFQNHYEIAIFLGGDDDFVDLINAVKNSAGKRVFGYYYPHRVSKRLFNSFDHRYELNENILSNIKKT
jgi:uncharacterized LabA/DUF88 family protein